MTRKKPLLGRCLIACHKNKRYHEILANGKLPVFDNISDPKKKDLLDSDHITGSYKLHLQWKK